VRRREVLIASVALLGLVVPTQAMGQGPSSKVQLAQLRYVGGNAFPRPTGLERLAWELDKRTSIAMALDVVALTLRDKRLFHFPFLYLGGDSAFRLPSEQELLRLRRFLVYGGTLLIDSAEARPGGGFDRSVRALIAHTLPDDSMKRIDGRHSVYKSFYLLDRAVGRVALVPYWEAVERDGRLLVLYTQNDLAGAWGRDNLGNWQYNVYPGGERQRELAFRWGINVVMYALCVDYKSDQVHIPFILKRRQWRPIR